MERLWQRRFALLVFLIAVLLVPAFVYAYTICNKYSDGCTICDFYSPKDEWQGSIEWCN
jgi:hypothetical protein